MTESYSREEIIGDHILTRLPVKSLLRYKRVCKSWRDLIKSSSFIKKHYDNESVGTRKIIAKFGVDYEAKPLPIRQFHLYLLPDKIVPGCVPTHQRIYYYGDVSDFRDMHGPIDGIFLLENGHFFEVRFAWWNPATKQCRVIPRFEFDIEEENIECYSRTLGMGFDKKNQDYKIIWLRTFRYEYPQEFYPKRFCALYSTKNDSWKLVETNLSCEREISYPLNFTYINGVFHWLIGDKDLRGSEVYNILTFDFETEEFQEMPGPPIPGYIWGTVLLRGGSLAVMTADDTKFQSMVSQYDIWQRIREDNWVKVYTLNPSIGWHNPIGIWEYDLYIFDCTERHSLECYDQSAKQVINLGFDFFAGLRSGDPYSFEYKESLFPIPLRTENPTEEDTVEYFFRSGGKKKLLDWQM